MTDQIQVRETGRGWLASLPSRGLAAHALTREDAIAEVRQSARGTLVRYPVALWYPGDHVLTMPGPVLVRRDGSSDTLPDDPNARKYYFGEEYGT